MKDRVYEEARQTAREDGKKIRGDTFEQKIFFSSQGSRPLIFAA